MMEPTKTLWKHLAAKFLGEKDPLDLVDPNVKVEEVKPRPAAEATLIHEFAAFCAAEMARNSVVALGYSSEGSTVTLQDRKVLLISEMPPMQQGSPFISITGQQNRPNVDGWQTAVPITGSR